VNEILLKSLKAAKKEKKESFAKKNIFSVNLCGYF
jgi:hypothetical protein